MITNDSAEEEAVITAHALVQHVMRPHAVTRCPRTGDGLWTMKGLCTQTQGRDPDRKQGDAGGGAKRGPLKSATDRSKGNACTGYVSVAAGQSGSPHAT